MEYYSFQNCTSAQRDRKIEPIQNTNEAHQEESKKKDSVPSKDADKVDRRLIRVRPLTRTTALAIYVFDKRPSTTTPRQILEACHDPQSHFPLFIIFNESNETYHIDKSTSSPMISTFDLPETLSSLKELKKYVDALTKKLRQKAHLVIKEVRLSCPGNLGKADCTLISNDLDRLVCAIRPDALLFFDLDNEHLPKNNPYRICFDNPQDGILERTDNASRVFNLPVSAESDKLELGAFHATHHPKKPQPRLDQEINTYFQRIFTQMNYQIPNSVKLGAWIHVSDILLHLELLKTKTSSAVSSNVMSLIKLPPPLSLREERTMAVYLVSSKHALEWGDLTTIASTRHHEPSLFVAYDQTVVYNPEKDIHEKKETYEILQCNILPIAPHAREDARDEGINTLTAIDPPLTPLTEGHFVEYLQVLKNKKYVNYRKLRLCLEANFDDDDQVGATVSRLVTRLLPDYLDIIHTARNEHDTRNYLMRLTTTGGFSLPLKIMKGHCISVDIILRALLQAKIKACPPGEDDVSTYDGNPSTLNCPPPDVEQENKGAIYLEIDHCLECNIIPEPLEPDEHPIELSSRSIAGISPSNKGFSLFRPRSTTPKENVVIKFGATTVTTYEAPKESGCCVLS